MLTIIQNDPEVLLGAYADYLAELELPYRLFHPYLGEMLPEAVEVSAVIVLGGAMGVHDTDRHPFLREVNCFIGGAIAQELPFLGICLGGQLLAHLLGAPVDSNSPFGEKGTLPVTLTDDGKADPLFAGVDREFVTFQWHNDSFAVPEGGVLLASSPACPNQAFRYGSNAYGIQFHPEVNREMVAEWSSWTPATAARTSEFLAGFDSRAAEYRSASRRLLVNFLRIARLA
jgi:GMP synthase-like glutamine amidotransferase